YPFQLHWVPATDARSATVQPEELRSFSEVYGDYGIAVLVTATSVIGRALAGPDYVVDDWTARRALLSLFLVTALVFVSPAVPLAVSASAVATFFLALRAGPVDFASARLWGVTLAALVASVFIAVATRSAPTTARWTTLFALGLLLAFTRLLRQDA